MIAISPTTGNSPYGPIIMDERAMSEAESREARISRTRTLDGGCVIVHSGAPDADRTLNITARITRAQAADFIGLYKTETLVIIGHPDGVFTGAIYQAKNDSGIITTRILFKEQINGSN